MAYEFKLPDLGEGLTEGEIARWLVAEGQAVAEDDPLVEIQTDKTTVEIPSPAAGTVSRILAAEGQVVPVGAVIVVIGNGPPAGEPAAPEPEAEPGTTSLPAPPPAGRPDGRVRATPLVRRLAQELGVDLARVAGTGPQGRVTESDVRAAVEGASGSEPRAPSPGRDAATGAARGSEPRAPSDERRIPLRGVRRQIAEHLARAHREIPAVTYVEECDLTGLDLQRLVPLALRAAALSLAEVPELNARLEGDELVLLERYDLGVAVQTEQGLVVPVVRDCDSRPLEELAADVARLADAARAGTLKPEELRGSTFTVTSAGKLGGLVVTPLINHPEVGILGLHRVAPRPVVRDGEIVVREVGNVSVTFDHRVVDGARAAEFGLAVIRRLELAASGEAL
ncbi:MAG TPA: dihydrolipoamide acetyltransferase family protein [Gaiellaceae bacterium]|nr:dihydrolipoamide acetyltransferase family protein [Gaiellaceae bacterium]